MYNVVLTSRRKKTFNIFQPPTLPLVTSSTRSENDIKVANAAMFAEALRRDKIIKSLVEKCPYKVKDIVQPKDKEDEAVYGKEIEILRICNSYAQFGRKEPWPEGDGPLMLVHAYSKDKNQYLTCTINYLKPKT